MKLNETLRRRKTGILQSLFMTAYAEENPTTDTTTSTPEETTPTETTPEPQATPPEPKGNFEELIARARKEERDKLYAEINRLKEQLNNTGSVAEDLNKEIESLKADKEKAEKEVERLQKELTDGTKSNRTVVELQGEVRKLNSELKKAQSSSDKEVAELKLAHHREVSLLKAQAEGVGFIPELVSGKTVEEIDASFEVAKQRYEEITSSVASQNRGGYTVPTMPRAKAQSGQPNAPQEVDVRSMSQAEYAKFRKENLGLR